MKKNIILTMVSLAALFIISGCESLDRSPDNQLSSGTFWKTETHARQAIVGVYAMFRDANICGEIFEEDAGGFIGTGYDRGFFNVVKGSYNSTTGVVTSKWSALYEGVARANSVIQNVSKMTDYLDQPTIDKYVGEAKFLRAYFYNMLLNYWGGVPIYDESIVVAEKFSEMKEPRSTAEQVREFILRDLDAAIAVLPEHGSWAASDYGRATKGAAQALKGKVLLYAKDYAGAATQFQSVISSGKYSLYKSYPDLFLPGGDASDEMIQQAANVRGINAFHSQVIKTVRGFDARVTRGEYETYINKHAIMYALFPVWFATFWYEGQHHTILINAQTGKVVGGLPWDKKAVDRLTIALSILFTIFCGVVLFGFYKVMGKPANFKEGFATLFMPVLSAVCGIGIWVMGKNKMKKVMKYIHLTQDSSLFKFVKKRQG